MTKKTCDNHFGSELIPKQVDYRQTQYNYEHGKLIIVIFSRDMLWKIQSGIVPPLFYVIIAEKDKMRTFKEFMCPRLKNAVDPDYRNNALGLQNVQSQQM